MSERIQAVSGAAERPSDETAAASGVTDTDSEGRVESTESQRTHWWVAASIVLAGTGFLVASPVLLAGATIPLWYAATPSLTGKPETTFYVERSLAVDGKGGDDARRAADEPLSGEPGDTVTVRTTVHNTGTEPAVDLRILDGVPDALPVVEGSPRTCVTLGAGEQTTIEYSIELQRGEHSFEEAALRVRDLTDVTRIDVPVQADGPRTLRCSPAVEQPPLGAGRNDYAGEVPTDDGGSGVEFHSVREYEPGDSVQSIDWRRYANTRDLATVEFRAERSTRVLCVVDARPSQLRAPVGSELSTLELCADAAERTAGRLLQEGHPTGTAGYYRGQLAMVPPGTSTAIRQRVSDFLGQLPAADRFPEATIRKLLDDPAMALPRAIDPETQVFLFSSFLDDKPLDLVEQLRSRGHGVCIVSPDVTGDVDAETEVTDAEVEDLPGTTTLKPLAIRLAGLDRERRLARARATGASVVEWELDQSLGLVLDRAVREVGP